MNFDLARGWNGARSCGKCRILKVAVMEADQFLSFKSRPSTLLALQGVLAVNFDSAKGWDGGRSLAVVEGVQLFQILSAYLMRGVCFEF